jgi:hypothetical protein
MAAKAAAIEARMRAPIPLQPAHDGLPEGGVRRSRSACAVAFFSAADARRAVWRFGWREPIPLARAPIGRIDIDQTSRSSCDDCASFPSGTAVVTRLRVC